MMTREPTELGRRIGHRVRRRREQKGLSQQALGRRVDVSQPYIARLEAGLRSPSVETLSRIADVLDVPTDLLLRPAPETPADRTPERLRERIVALYRRETDAPSEYGALSWFARQLATRPEYEGTCAVDTAQGWVKDPDASGYRKAPPMAWDALEAMEGEGGDS